MGKRKQQPGMCEGGNSSTVLSLPPTQDGEEIDRKPGDRWLIQGPLEYVPPVKVEVLEQRHSIPLAESEGIYVRDIKTGKVSRADGTAVTGYLLLLETGLPCAVQTLQLAAPLGPVPSEVTADKSITALCHTLACIIY